MRTYKCYDVLDRSQVFKGLSQQWLFKLFLQDPLETVWLKKDVVAASLCRGVGRIGVTVNAICGK